MNSKQTHLSMVKDNKNILNNRIFNLKNRDNITHIPDFLLDCNHRILSLISSDFSNKIKQQAIINNNRYKKSSIENLINSTISTPNNNKLKARSSQFNIKEFYNNNDNMSISNKYNSVNFNSVNSSININTNTEKACNVNKLRQSIIYNNGLDIDNLIELQQNHNDLLLKKNNNSSNYNKLDIINKKENVITKKGDNKIVRQLGKNDFKQINNKNIHNNLSNLDNFNINKSSYFIFEKNKLNPAQKINTKFNLNKSNTVNNFESDANSNEESLVNNVNKKLNTQKEFTLGNRQNKANKLISLNNNSTIGVINRNNSKNSHTKWKNNDNLTMYMNKSTPNINLKLINIKDVNKYIDIAQQHNSNSNVGKASKINNNFNNVVLNKIKPTCILKKENRNINSNTNKIISTKSPTSTKSQLFKSLGFVVNQDEEDFVPFYLLKDHLNHFKEKKLLVSCRICNEYKSKYNYSKSNNNVKSKEVKNSFRKSNMNFKFNTNSNAGTNNNDNLKQQNIIAKPILDFNIINPQNSNINDNNINIYSNCKPENNSQNKKSKEKKSKSQLAEKRNSQKTNTVNSIQAQVQLILKEQDQKDKTSHNAFKKPKKKTIKNFSMLDIKMKNLPYTINDQCQFLYRKTLLTNEDLLNFDSKTTNIEEIVGLSRKKQNRYLTFDINNYKNDLARTMNEVINMNRKSNFRQSKLNSLVKFREKFSDNKETLFKNINFQVTGTQKDADFDLMEINSKRKNTFNVGIINMNFNDEAKNNNTTSNNKSDKGTSNSNRLDSDIINKRNTNYNLSSDRMRLFQRGSIYFTNDIDKAETSRRSNFDDNFNSAIKKIRSSRGSKSIKSFANSGLKDNKTSYRKNSAISGNYEEKQDEYLFLKNDADLLRTKTNRTSASIKEANLNDDNKLKSVNPDSNLNSNVNDNNDRRMSIRSRNSQRKDTNLYKNKNNKEKNRLKSSLKNSPFKKNNNSVILSNTKEDISYSPNKELDKIVSISSRSFSMKDKENSIENENENEHIIAKLDKKTDVTNTTFAQLDKKNSDYINNNSNSNTNNLRNNTKYKSIKDTMMSFKSHFNKNLSTAEIMRKVQFFKDYESRTSMANSSFHSNINNDNESMIKNKSSDIRKNLKHGTVNPTNRWNSKFSSLKLDTNNGFLRFGSSDKFGNINYSNNNNNTNTNNSVLGSNKFLRNKKNNKTVVMNNLNLKSNILTPNPEINEKEKRDYIRENNRDKDDIISSNNNILSQINKKLINPKFKNSFKSNLSRNNNNLQRINSNNSSNSKYNNIIFNNENEDDIGVIIESLEKDEDYKVETEKVVFKLPLHKKINDINYTGNLINKNFTGKNSKNSDTNSYDSNKSNISNIRENNYNIDNKLNRDFKKRSVSMKIEDSLSLDEDNSERDTISDVSLLLEIQINSNKNYKEKIYIEDKHKVQTPVISDIFDKNKILSDNLKEIEKNSSDDKTDDILFSTYSNKELSKLKKIDIKNYTEKILKDDGNDHFQESRNNTKKKTVVSLFNNKSNLIFKDDEDDEKDSNEILNGDSNLDKFNTVKEENEDFDITCYKLSSIEVNNNVNNANIHKNKRIINKKEDNESNISIFNFSHHDHSDESNKSNKSKETIDNKEEINNNKNNNDIDERSNIIRKSKRGLKVSFIESAEKMMLNKKNKTTYNLIDLNPIKKDLAYNKGSQECDITSNLNNINKDNKDNYNTYRNKSPSLFNFINENITNNTITEESKREIKTARNYSYRRMETNLHQGELDMKKTKFMSKEKLLVVQLKEENRKKNSYHVKRHNSLSNYSDRMLDQEISDFKNIYNEKISCNFGNDINNDNIDDICFDTNEMLNRHPSNFNNKNNDSKYFEDENNRNKSLKAQTTRKLLNMLNSETFDMKNSNIINFNKTNSMDMQEEIKKNNTSNILNTIRNKGSLNLDTHNKSIKKIEKSTNDIVEQYNKIFYNNKENDLLKSKRSIKSVKKLSKLDSKMSYTLNTSNNKETKTIKINENNKINNEDNQETHTLTKSHSPTSKESISHTIESELKTNPYSIIEEESQQTELSDIENISIDSGIYVKGHKELLNRKVGYYYGIKEYEEKKFYGDKANDEVFSLVKDKRKTMIQAFPYYSELKNPINKIKEMKILLNDNNLPGNYIKHKTVMSQMNNIKNSRFLIPSVLNDTNRMVEVKDRQDASQFEMSEFILNQNKIRKRYLMNK